MGVVEIFVLIFLGTLGACFGSFACCQAWRIHENGLGKRSVCIHCKKQLKWYDNIPVISWILLRGKCRMCKKPIGKAEILSEIMVAAIFVLFGVLFFSNMYPFNYQEQAMLIGENLIPENFKIIIKLVPLVLLLIEMTLLWILTVHDAKWGELPTGILVAANIIALLFFISRTLILCMQDGYFGLDGVWKKAVPEVVMGVAILGGIYYLLYFFSKEKLVGGGDWILCIAIAIMLSSWQFAIIELFLANFLALIVSSPAALLKKKKQFSFAPFLVVAFVLVISFSYPLIKAFL